MTPSSGLVVAAAAVAAVAVDGVGGAYVYARRAQHQHACMLAFRVQAYLQACGQSMGASESIAHGGVREQGVTTPRLSARAV